MGNDAVHQTIGMLSKPTKVNILGIEYQVKYVDNPAEVDIFKRTSLWGQCDYWTRTIRVYDRDLPIQDVCQILMHEILHAIAELLHLKTLMDTENHDELDLLALALVDTFVRNGWLKE